MINYEIPFWIVSTGFFLILIAWLHDRGHYEWLIERLYRQLNNEISSKQTIQNDYYELEGSLQAINDIIIQWKSNEDTANGQI